MPGTKSGAASRKRSLVSAAAMGAAARRGRASANASMRLRASVAGRVLAARSAPDAMGTRITVVLRRWWGLAVEGAWNGRRYTFLFAPRSQPAVVDVPREPSAFCSLYSTWILLKLML